MHFINGTCRVTWLILALFFSFDAAAGSNQTLVYQGRITRPDGTAISSGMVSFSLSVYSPSPTKCLLYSESQTIDMSGSMGMFSLQLGSGSRVDAGAHSFKDVFVNGKTLSGLTCASGSAYIGSATDDRELLVSFNDAGTVVHLASMAIRSVPFALEAHEIDGWGLGNLVKVSSVGSPTTFTTTEMAVAKNLTSLSCATNEILKFNGTSWACATDATGGSPGDAGYTTVNKGIVAFDTDAATSGITVAAGLAKLSTTGVAANTYGSATAIPSITVNAQGRITAASATAIAIPVSQLTQSGAASGEVLKWNGSAWVPAPDLTGTTPGDATYSAKGIVQFNTDAATSGISLSSGVATVNYGTGANQIVKLDGSSRLPAVDGSALTNLNANNISSGTLPISRGGTGASTKTSAFDALSPTSAKGDITVHNGTSNISLPRGSDGQVLTTDSAQASGLKWSNAAAGTVTSVTGGTGLTGGTITSAGTLAVDVGTGANQIVQMTAASKLPAVDGSLLTNLSTNQISAGTLPVSRGGTGASSFAANNLVGTNGTGSALQAVTCAQNQVLSFDASGFYGCYNLSTLAGGTYFANGGNSFAGAATLGTNDSNALNFITSGTARAMIDATGNVGIGTTAPVGKLNLVHGNVGVANGNVTDGMLISTSNAIAADVGGSLMLGGLYSGLSTPVAFGGISGRKYNATNGNRSGYLQFAISDNVGAMTEAMRINYNGNVGIGTTNPGAPLDVKGEIRMTGSTSGYAGLKSPATGPSVTWTLPTADGSAGQFLKTDGSGNLSWASASTAAITSLNGLTAATQTFAIGTSGTAPAFSSATATHTLNIPMASTASVTAGLISKTDYDTFNTKLGTSTSFSGDVSGTYNATSVDKIKAAPVSISSLSSGNFLKYNGSAWVNTSLASADITGALGYTPVNKAGDTMSGSLDLASKNITSVGTLAFKGSTSGTLSMTVPATVTSYTVKWPSAVAASSGQALTSDTSGNLSWTTVPSTSNTFVNNGNSFGGTATLGTNDGNALNLATYGTTHMTIDAVGNVGIGTTSPTYAFEVSNPTSLATTLNAKSYAAEFTFNLGAGGNDSRLQVLANRNTGAQSGHDYGDFRIQRTIDSTQMGYIAFNGGAGTTGNRGVQIGFNDTPAMTMIANGNVGIGTTSPGARLDVQQTDTSTAATTIVTSGAILTASPTAASSAKFQSFAGNSNFNGTVNSPSAQVYGFSANSSNVSTVTLGSSYGVWASSTNTSTGTMTSAYGVASSISNSSTGTVTNGKALYSTISNPSGTLTNGYGLYVDTIQATNKWSIYTNDSTAPSYFAGNVGIGTASPGTKLEIAESGSGMDTKIQMGLQELILDSAYNTGSSGEKRIAFYKSRGTLASPAAVQNGDEIGALYWYGMDGNLSNIQAAAIVGVADAAPTSGHTPIGFQFYTDNGTTFTSRFSIASNGNVGIGAPTPSYPLEVVTTGTGAVARFKNAATAANSPVAIFATNSTASCTVTAGGQLQCTSDVRLKKDITQIQNALDGILNLDGIRYHLKSEKSSDPLHIGFKAQQLKEVYPEVVGTDEKGYFQVSYAPFVAVVVEAIKEFYGQWSEENQALHRELTAVRAENAIQKKEIADLKAFLCSKEKEAAICQPGVQAH